LPCVIVDIMRGGPGLGNIAPEQSDYNQIVKGGGHGNYRALVLAPNCAQEMCDLTMLAFELADKYRNPVYVLADGFIGQMMEPVEFPEPVQHIPEKPWAIRGTVETVDNLISSIELDPDDLEALNESLQKKYRQMQAEEVRVQTYRCDDAEIMLFGFGIVSRVLHSAVDELRELGIKAGMLRPITLFPFPVEEIREYIPQVESFWVMELNNGQMVDDVRLAVGNAVPVCFHGRMGGNVISTEEVITKVRERKEETV
ncbi:MAG TPA: 3-methyl-2-oxobutanoate dehydrogenase subunit beta, partial [bacterium]|nr:3-methyl-2-oxobutanoate dehydrogenase subunit beta [bacterium]